MPAAPGTPRRCTIAADMRIVESGGGRFAIALDGAVPALSTPKDDLHVSLS